MYLNLIQIAESFGVSERVVEGWVRDEGLPSTPDRGRLLFDRAQVAQWAATRGLAAQVGFLAPVNPALASGLRLGSLLRAGGIWRDVSAAEVPAVFERIVHRLMAVGGKFEVRSLTAPSEPAFEVELPRSKTAVFRRLEDVVTPAAGTYYTPSAPRSSPPSSVDGILSAVVPVKGDR